jgi:hypothetical protein
MAFLTSLLISLIMLIHPWRFQTLVARPPRPPRTPRTRAAQMADAAVLLVDGWRFVHEAGVRFRIEVYYRRVPKGGLR